MYGSHASRTFLPYQENNQSYKQDHIDSSETWQGKTGKYPLVQVLEGDADCDVKKTVDTCELES